MSARRWSLVFAVVVLAGCANFGDERIDDPIEVPPSTSPTASGAKLVFGGVLVDARDGAPVDDATIRLDLSQTLPCGRQGIGWTSWEIPIVNGTWGPLEVPRPRSDDVAFFLHARAPAYAENVTFIGPTQARGDISTIRVAMHPDVAVEGTAPPGTIVALDAPAFPRVEVTAANGSFRFPQARAVAAGFVAATDDPYRSVVTAPANVTVPMPDARGWLFEGVVKGPSGAPMAADIVAWNGTRLLSAARAGDNGVFTLPLPPQGASFRVEARTSNDHYGGVRPIEISGPPALRETILVNPLC